MAEAKEKTAKAAASFNQQHNTWNQQKHDQAMDYKHTTMSNLGVALTNQKLRERTENTIKYLEEQEIAMVSKMQQTLAKKDKAF